MNEWVKFTIEFDEDLQMNIINCALPDDEEAILVCTGNGFVTEDRFLRDGEECYLDSGWEIGTDVIAWMPMPKPYEEVS